MGEQNEGATTVGVFGAQADGYVSAIYEAERLEAQAKALYAKAETLRGQHRITVLISSGHGGFGVLVRVGGKVYSTGPARSAEEACQLAYHFIQGYQPPLRLPPFGTPVDQKRSEILEGFVGTAGTERNVVPKS